MELSVYGREIYTALACSFELTCDLVCHPAEVTLKMYNILLLWGRVTKLLYNKGLHVSMLKVSPSHRVKQNPRTN